MLTNGFHIANILDIFLVAGQEVRNPYFQVPYTKLHKWLLTIGWLSCRYFRASDCFRFALLALYTDEQENLFERTEDCYQRASSGAFHFSYQNILYMVSFWII